MHHGIFVGDTAILRGLKCCSTEESSIEVNVLYPRLMNIFKQPYYEK